MTSCIPTDLLFSKGTRLNLEHQPAVQQLQTTNYIFGYQFEPSLPVEELLKTNYPRVYNPLNDLLNPISYSPDEVVKLQAKEYMEEQLLREKYKELKERKVLLDHVPERLRPFVSRLYTIGALTETDRNISTTFINQQLNKGLLTEGDAIQLRKLIDRRSTLQQLTNQVSDISMTGELNSIVHSVIYQLENRGINPQTAKYLAQRAVREELEDSGLSPPRDLSFNAMERAIDIADAMGDSVESNVEEKEADRRLLDEFDQEFLNPDAIESFGSRMSRPIAPLDQQPEVISLVSSTYGRPNSGLLLYEPIKQGGGESGAVGARRTELENVERTFGNGGKSRDIRDLLTGQIGVSGIGGAVFREPKERKPRGRGRGRARARAPERRRPFFPEEE